MRNRAMSAENIRPMMVIRLLRFFWLEQWESDRIPNAGTISQ